MKTAASSPNMENTKGKPEKANIVTFEVKISSHFFCSFFTVKFVYVFITFYFI